nr:hypothetical protein [Tanacetum cinerariifolium]
MVNVIPPDHVYDAPVVEPNQHDVPVILEPVLVDEDEDPKEDEFKEEEDPQEEEDDIKVYIEEYENEPELTYPYEEVDPLNPLPPASELKLKDAIKQGTAAMEKLVEKLGNDEDKAECKKFKKELEEARIMPLKSASLNQAAIRQMIKDNVDAAIATERARKANVRNDASRFGPTRGQDATPAAH